MKVNQLSKYGINRIEKWSDAKRKTTNYLASIALLTGYSAANSNNTKTDNPYYKVEKIKTVGGGELDKVTISGPPTPPKGFKRPIVKPNMTNKTDTNVTLGKDPIPKDKDEGFIK